MSQPEHPEDRLNRSWTTNAEAWTRVVREGRIASRQRGTDRAIVEAVARCQPQRVLDVGCGEGWLVNALAAHGIDAVGVDGSAPLVEAARERGGTFLLLTYDEIAANPVQLGGPYDAVVCNFALLAEDIQPLLRALRACLRPGGHLLIQTVHPFTALDSGRYENGWRVESFAGFGDTFAEPMPWYFRTVGAWIEAVHTAGYALESCQEPMHADAERPLSLLLVCQAV